MKHMTFKLVETVWHSGLPRERLYDIRYEIELEALYQNGLVDKDNYLTANDLRRNIALKWRRKWLKTQGDGERC
ncbi:MAG: hypothetical protein ACLS3V_07290 [Streptococcus sp.]